MPAKLRAKVIAVLAASRGNENQGDDGDDRGLEPKLPHRNTLPNQPPRYDPAIAYGQQNPDPYNQGAHRTDWSPPNHQPRPLPHSSTFPPNNAYAPNGYGHGGPEVQQPFSLHNHMPPPPSGHGMPVSGPGPQYGQQSSPPPFDVSSPETEGYSQQAYPQLGYQQQGFPHNGYPPQEYFRQGFPEHQYSSTNQGYQSQPGPVGHNQSYYNSSHPGDGNSQSNYYGSNSNQVSDYNQDPQQQTYPTDSYGANDHMQPYRQHTW